MHRIDWRFRRSKADAKTRRLQQFNSLYSFLPRSRAAVGIVILRPSPIQADLHNEVFVRNSTKFFQANATQEHCVRQYGRLDAGGGISQHLINVIEQKRFAAGKEDVFESQFDRFIYQASDVLHSQGATRRIWTGFCHAIGTL